MTEQSSAEFEKSITVIMAEITKLIQVLTVNYKEQMEEQARRDKEQMNGQARQSREQEEQHAERMAVLIAIDQIKTRDADIKYLIETARDWAKANPTPVATFEPFDSSSELWLGCLERFRTFLVANSIPEEKEAQVFLTNQTTVTDKLLSNLTAKHSPVKGTKDLSTDDIKKFMGE